MDTLKRFNVTSRGDGQPTYVFGHGFGCDQSMWRLVAPRYAERARVVCYDLAGNGQSDLAAYDLTRHGRLEGHADDLIEILHAIGGGPVVFVGHSVSAMIGLLAGVRAPELFESQIWLGPSPCYVNDGDYVGGFTRSDIDSLLDTLDSNYLGWSSTMAPVIMGAPDQPHLATELTNSFCRTDPDIAKHFARVTFLSDNRADVAQLQVPTLVLQCSDDLIAPRSVGEFLARSLPRGTLRVINNVGHCPHLSAPCESMAAMDEFLASHAESRVCA
ncbi:alpha/beta fold hydrolase [Cognatilysobacter bugurensis]|uniref:Sigma factor sigB regulation protein rsbQ n=1 Tax=Cognatilysobacter bugurensis TaxID=543356 RepID=A0A918W941_9GAMM|nr:alpha/beta hydrolase [Lysobacter bugurensis]GHA83293.1 sigma factor sigB regulation protein rsbQ [Lysobacter bugurensis]